MSRRAWPHRNLRHTPDIAAPDIAALDIAVPPSLTWNATPPLPEMEVSVNCLTGVHLIGVHVGHGVIVGDPT
jgi:hypothetical protein